MKHSNQTQVVPNHNSRLAPITLAVAILIMALCLLDSGPRGKIPESNSVKTHASGKTGSEAISTTTGPSSSVERPPVLCTKEEPTAATHPIQDKNRKFIQLNLALLERGLEQLLQVSDYTATFLKQERINGELSNQQQMELKLRHQPFSIYLKSLIGDVGREVLYVQGQNNGKLLVHYGGWKALVLPILKLDPHGILAFAENRHPITKMGILELTRELIEYRRRDLMGESHIRCYLQNSTVWNNRKCFRFEIEYDNQDNSQLYRKSIQYIDKQLSLPVCIRNFTWADPNLSMGQQTLDEVTFIEHYAYSDLNLNAKLGETDFDQNSDQYRFRRD